MSAKPQSIIRLLQDATRTESDVGKPGLYSYSIPTRAELVLVELNHTYTPKNKQTKQTRYSFKLHFISTAETVTLINKLSVVLLYELIQYKGNTILSCSCLCSLDHSVVKSSLHYLQVKCSLTVVLLGSHPFGWKFSHQIKL